MGRVPVVLRFSSDVALVVLVEHLVMPLVVGVVTALAAVWLALRRFRAERWWERKAAAYSSIFDSLHVMKRGLGDDLRFLENPNRPSDEERERDLLKQYRAARDEVYRAVDTSSFLLSEEAADTLHQLTVGIEKPETQAHRDGRPLDPGDLSLQVDAIDVCLRRLPRIARQDLEIIGPRWLAMAKAAVRWRWGS